MSTQTTAGIKVKVKPHFRADLSEVEEGRFLFQYDVLIENNNAYAVQLLEREWIIFDASNDVKLVRGQGVVGQMPLIQSNEAYAYSSACELFSDFGSMRGNYIFLNTITGQKFEVEIPLFKLEFPPRLN